MTGCFPFVLVVPHEPARTAQRDLYSKVKEDQAGCSETGCLPSMHEGLRLIFNAGKRKDPLNKRFGKNQNGLEITKAVCEVKIKKGRQQALGP